MWYAPGTVPNLNKWDPQKAEGVAACSITLVPPRRLERLQAPPKLEGLGKPANGDQLYCPIHGGRSAYLGRE